MIWIFLIVALPFSVAITTLPDLVPTTCVSDCTGLDNGAYQSCENCTSYSNCWAGVLATLPCQPGTLWDDQKKYCDTTSDTCHPSMFTTTTIASTLTTTTTISTPAITLTPTTASLINVTCVEDCTGKYNGDYQSCETCSGYVSCWDEELTAQLCPDFFLWDDQKKYCDTTSDTCHPSMFTTTTIASTLTTTTIISTPAITLTPTTASLINVTCVEDCTGKYNGDYQSCETCSGYVSCWDEELTAQLCPDFLLWDDQRKFCDDTSDTCHPDITVNFPSTVSTTLSTTGITCISDCTGIDNGDYQSCGTCSGYVSCWDEELTIQICPIPLLWDDQKKYCDATSDTCNPDMFNTTSTASITPTTSSSTEESSTITPMTSSIEAMVSDSVTIPAFTIHPLFGPAAGGTMITLEGNNFNHITVIAFEPVCNIDCANMSTLLFTGDTIFERSNSHILISTPSLELYGNNDTLTQQNALLYNVIVMDAFNNTYHTGKVFEYRPNPLVTNITSRLTTLSGGIRITMVGDNLNSVATPLFIVYMEEKLHNNPNKTVQRFTATVNEYSKNKLVAKTPPIDLSNISKSSIDNYFSNGGKSMEYDDVLEFYLGLIMDGFTEYEDFRETIPEAASLNVSQDPTFDEYDKVFSFDPRKDKTIAFKGESLTNGAKIEDYSIEIGRGICKVSQLFDNQITCEPPKHEPRIIKRGNYKDGKPKLFVNCGHARYFIGHVNYVDDMTIYIIIGSVAASIITIITIVVIVAKCMCKDPPKRNPFGSPEDQYGSDYYDDVRIGNDKNWTFPQILPFRSSNLYYDNVNGVANEGRQFPRIYT